MTARTRFPRWLAQAACLAGAAMLLWLMPPWATASGFFIQASPFVALSSSIANRAIGLGAGLSVVVAVLSVVRKRWFCLYVCPTGFLLENASRQGLRKTGWWTKLPPVGRHAAILTIVGAVAGYPVLLWMDPLSIFSGPFALRNAANPVSGLLVGFGLGTLIAATLVLGMVWCVRICPLGAIQDLLFSTRSLFSNRSTATPSVQQVLLTRRVIVAGAVGAGLGLWARKAGAARASDTLLRPPGAVAEERFTGLCIRCNNCVRVCPSKIIRLDIGEAGLAGLLAPLIRYDKDNYCLEDCNACTQVCPSGALQPLDLPHKNRHIIGEALVDTTLCLLTLGKKDCDACERSCPFDAIRIVWDEKQYVAYPVIDPTKCNGCGACEVVCPTTRVKAIRVWSPQDTLTTA